MRVAVIVGITFACCWHSAMAGDIESADFQRGCGELLKITQARGERRYLAWESTSASQAMRAGLCQGTLSEYLRHGQCPRGTRVAVRDWYEMAQRVVAVDLGKARGLSKLLDTAACGDGGR